MNDACAAAWDRLNESLPSLNMGERGQQLTEQMATTKPLTKCIDKLAADIKESKQPRPRAFVVSAGYNCLQDEPKETHGEPTFVTATLISQVDRLHDLFPDVPVLLLGLAVDKRNARPEISLASSRVTASLMAYVREDDACAATRARWLTVLHPDTWLSKCSDPVWEPEEQPSGSTLHLSIRSRVTQLSFESLLVGRKPRHLGFVHNHSPPLGNKW